MPNFRFLTCFIIIYIYVLNYLQLSGLGDFITAAYSAGFYPPVRNEKLLLRNQVSDEYKRTGKIILMYGTIALLWIFDLNWGKFSTVLKLATPTFIAFNWQLLFDFVVVFGVDFATTNIRRVFIDVESKISCRLFDQNEDDLGFSGCFSDYVDMLGRIERIVPLSFIPASRITFSNVKDILFS